MTDRRVVVEVPGSLAKTERDAVHVIQDLVKTAISFSRVKLYKKVRTAERRHALAGKKDLAGQLRRVRDQLNEVIEEVEP